MANEYPLIRIPTQSARLTLFEVFAFCGFFIGALFGISIGHHFFGTVGAIFGAAVCGFLGFVIGFLPRYWLQELMFRKMQQSSNGELKSRLEDKPWTFFQTLALLNLQARGENVQPYLAGILILLESDDRLARLFARDALRLVFTPLSVHLDELGFDPNASVEDRCKRIARLREQISGSELKL